MNKRQLTKFSIYTVAVLSTTLINGYIVQYIGNYIHGKRYLLVLIDMLVVLLIFAPAFGIVSKYAKKISQAYIKTSKKVSSKNNSLFFVFAVAFIILFILFALLRHNIDVVNDIKIWINK